ncbi:VWA domain-containing protein [Microbulbifer elongatus]|uniref:VWA domain-containing protein n=1 Tax=Microbulbifer elongatus TaxID=86173 RepID=UPI001E4FDCE7|nr:VWA domain-containing protein [Microbulbifer elongatus]
MSELLVNFSALHFLRPLWLLAVPVILVVWWWLRFRPDAGAAVPAQMAPHLAKALQVGQRKNRWLRPIDTIAGVLLCLALGTAGPSWSRVPDPLMSRTAPMVMVLSLSNSMEQTDIPPSRYERARQKMLDMLNIRDGAPTALVAYAGSVHRVVPLTDDVDLLRPYIEGLSPEVMPEPGNNAAGALKLAQRILKEKKTPGAILFMLDDLPPDQLSAFSQREPGYGLGFLVMTPGGKSASVDKIKDAKVVAVTPDQEDLQSLDRYFEASYQNALLDDDTQQWEDRGWWLAWPAALLALLWFRRGWVIEGRTVSILLALTLVPLLALPTPARAEGFLSNTANTIADWLLTPDQKGQVLMYRKNYKAAAEAFTDPSHKAHALYMSGQYEAAAKAFATIDTADAATFQGIAEIKSRQYRPAVRSFERALQLDPEYPDGEINIQLAKQIVEFVETTREQSDTGEEGGIGADEIKFDNEANKGTDTESAGKGEAPVSAEQWISTLNTKTEDFLRQRFAIEATDTGDEPQESE